VETHLRSILKAVTWRVAAFVITATIAWLITGQAGLAASIGLADTVLKLFLFYAHERAWQKVRFGRAAPPEYEL